MDNPLKLVSVIIPAFNARNTIVNTLNSVYNQSYKNIEIIVVNDGSTDETLNIVNNYRYNNHQSISLKIIDKPNGGVSTARNVGLKLAKGEFIALLDSDDEWLPNKLERQLNIFENYPYVEFLGTNRNGEFYDKVLWKKFSKLTKIGAKFLLVKFIFVTPTIIFRSYILKEVGYFDEQQKYAEEGNYFIRICNKFNCYLLNESLVITGGGKNHFGDSGLSGNIKEMEKGELKNLAYARRLGIVNYLEYLLLVGFSLLKYLRRVIIVKTRK